METTKTAYQHDHEKAVRAIEVAAEFTPELKDAGAISPASAINLLAYLLAHRPEKPADSAPAGAAPDAYMFDIKNKRLGQRRQFAAIEYHLDPNETLISKSPLYLAAPAQLPAGRNFGSDPIIEYKQPTLDQDWDLAPPPAHVAVQKGLAVIDAALREKEERRLAEDQRRDVDRRKGVTR